MEQYVIFNLSDKKFAVRLKYVSEISENKDTTKIINTPEYINGICHVRNDVCTIIDLSILFKIKTQPKFPKTILCTYHDSNIGLCVEEVIDILYLSLDETTYDNSSDFMNFISKTVDYNSEPIYIINLGSIISYKEEI